MVQVRRRNPLDLDTLRVRMGVDLDTGAAVHVAIASRAPFPPSQPAGPNTPT